MNDNKTSRAQRTDEPLTAAEFCQRVDALLTTKDGIDESKAKRLRKQWELHALSRHDDSADTQVGNDADDGANELLANQSAVVKFAELRTRIHAQVELRNKQFASVESALAQLRIALANGDVKQSEQLAQSVVDGMHPIVGLSKQRRLGVNSAMDALQPKLEKLTSWRKWGTVQTRKKMITEIENIHQSGISLADIVRRIQHARKEWQQWDAAGDGGDKRRYAVFDRACVAAYQPCQAYFDKQKQRRQENTHHREKICALLEQEFENEEWRNPPWKKLQQLVGAQTILWRKSGQGDFSQRKRLQQRFDAAVGQFNDPLDRERTRNRTMREKLIEDVQVLAEQQNSRAALIELSALKKQWIPTVSSARGKEQKLWKQFTAACDAVYAKRDDQRKEFERTLKSNLAAKIALCEQIETACRDAAKNGAPMNEPMNENLKKWKSQWTQCGEVRQSSSKKINERYRNALTEAGKVLAEVKVAAKQHVHALLCEKSQLCADVERLALTADTKNAKPESESEDLAARWEKNESLPTEWADVLGARYRLANAAMSEAGALKQLRDALSANLETMHELLVRLEILAELDSPPEFSRHRMALQIERLSAAMGKGEKSVDNQSATELVRAILLVGAVDADAHAAAFVRLDICLAAGEIF